MKKAIKSAHKKRFGGNRERVLERDNFECQMCGMTQEQHILLFSRSLTIDHIDGNGRYADYQNNDLDNLITLCLRCHGRKDHRRKNNNQNEKGGNLNGYKRKAKEQ